MVHGKDRSGLGLEKLIGLIYHTARHSRSRHSVIEACGKHGMYDRSVGMHCSVNKSCPVYRAVPTPSRGTYALTHRAKSVGMYCSVDKSCPVYRAVPTP
ncbi:hypothetical protein ElyMa_006673400 [Elysia marginata]|uniref:Uncharacterized protein n=1 Tax=Elysia marginata TaxID=1093978 RepID=A0AAV4INI1_9GAST|nr:hypothetical protein ElyMa_006673400 [Elysia marginata]